MKYSQEVLNAARALNTSFENVRRNGGEISENWRCEQEAKDFAELTDTNYYGPMTTWGFAKRIIMENGGE